MEDLKYTHEWFIRGMTADEEGRVHEVKWGLRTTREGTDIVAEKLGTKTLVERVYEEGEEVPEEARLYEYVEYQDLMEETVIGWIVSIYGKTEPALNELKLEEMALASELRTITEFPWSE